MMRVSVRGLCEFTARRGSLDNRYTPAPSAEDGRVAHATVQQSRTGNYQAEYALQGEIEGVALRGRADGYRPKGNEDTPFLEEIKSHRGSLDRLNNDRRHLHWAQLKVYGALLCLRDGHSDVDLNLCYVDIDSDREQSLTQRYCAQELIAYAKQLCRAYLAWQSSEQQHRHARDAALLPLSFCYPDFRPGQRQLAEDAYKTVATGSVAMIEAPTGLGKTLGVLYPHLNAMPRYNIDRLYLLSNRNTGKTLWREALQQLEPTNIRVIQLDARHNACDNPALACHGESCPLALGFFDRLPAAREAAAKAQWLDTDGLANIAAAHGICRYYLGQEMARWCDIIIADVNHYFDQQALLFALKQQEEWRVAICIDEAHNLIERTRGMYSAAISEQPIVEYGKRAPSALKPALVGLKKAWRQIIKQQPSREVQFLSSPPASLVSAGLKFASQAADYMVDHPGDGELQELMFSYLGFARLSEQFEDHSLAIIRQDMPPGTRNARGELAIQNIDPNTHIRPRWLACHSALLFSATLQPFEYYRDLLGIEDVVLRAIDSPFRRDQLELRLVSDIDTRYKYRQQSVQSIAQRIAWQYSRTPGNYLVYTPSFAYQKLLQDALDSLPLSLPLVMQTPVMNEASRHEFIHGFRQHRGRIGLATLGGIFGEGIDLPGDELIGVTIISLGLPPFDDFHRRIEKYFSHRYGSANGYRYTYLFPAMRKIVQAAGRLLRSQSDQGLIELIDPRFEQDEIKSLLPPWWF